ncbi:MAG: tetratricopeptide repeat protein, partial [Acidobacteria bacterium]|nr:tetratricopeptide repeat protein [Acidobacteriota bacterium]
LDALLADPAAAPAPVAEAFGNLGLLYVTYEFLDAAQVCFENAGRVAPEDYRWTYLAGYLHRIRGRLDRAASAFEESLRLRPDYLPAILRLGQVRAEQGEPEAAEALYRRALELEPQASPAYEGLGNLAAARGDDAAAVEAYEKALELEPQASALHYLLGISYRNLGDLEQAQIHLEQRGETPTRIIDPLLNPLASRAASSQFYLVQGAEALESGDAEGAAAAYRQAVEQAPSSLTAHRGLSSALDRLGDSAGALKALEEGAAAAESSDGIDPFEHAQLLVQLGDRLEQAGRMEEALAQLDRSLELAPDQPLLELRVANAKARAGRLEEAVEGYSGLLEGGRLDAAPGGLTASQVLEKRATAYVNLGRRQEAHADFEEALRRAPQDGRLRLRYAEALEFFGEKDAARAQREQAAKLLADSPQRLLLMVESARQLAASGDLPAAAAKLREVLAEAPESVEARLGLATVLGNGGRYGEAVDEFRRVLKLAPDHAPARRGLVEALILAGDFARARVEVAEALRRQPRDLGLALIQVRLLATAPDPSVRDGSLAVEVGLRIVEEHRTPRTLLALACAHAEAGDFDPAVALTAELLESARSRGDTVEVARLEARLSAFEEARPWTAASGEEILGF